MKLSLTLIILFNLSSILSFGQTFSEHFIGPEMDELTSFSTTDIDGDGDLDLLGSADFINEIFWFENTDGQGTFSFIKYISTSSGSSESVFASDLDGDGDQDILSAMTDEGEIVWFKNLDGAGSFSEKIIIANGYTLNAYVSAKDLDNDGDLDVLASGGYDGKIMWFENINGQGDFSNEIIISDSVSATDWVEATDMDNDGDQDVVYYTYAGDQISWFKNLDGQGDFGEEKLIGENVKAYGPIVISDLDNDGDQDVLYSSNTDDKIAWFKNEDGIGNFGAELIINENNDDKRGVSVIDYDGDGDQDIICALYQVDRIGLYENLDGTDDFGPRVLAGNGSFDVVLQPYSADIDGDGYKDIIGASLDQIGFYKSMDSSGNFEGLQNITLNFSSIISLSSADLDGDGDQDVIAGYIGGENSIQWYENTGGNIDNFKYINPISDISANPSDLISIDYDGDNDIDLLSAHSSQNRIYFHENIDGQGNFGTPKILVNSAILPVSIILSDIDMDGDEDLISASSFDSKIAWYEKIDGTDSVGVEQIVDSNVSTVCGVLSADFDQDGDNDLMGCSLNGNDHVLVWYENDGQGNFVNEHIILTYLTFGQVIDLADYNNDDMIDIVICIEEEKLIFLKNLGNGLFSNEVILSNTVNDVLDIISFDVDMDGDLDIVCIQDQVLYWFNNVDGLGNFSNALISTSSLSGFTRVLDVADLDNDGDSDLISGGPYLVWLENFTNLPNISGKVFYDENNNGIADANEIGLENQQVSIQPDAASSWTLGNGNFGFAVDTGTYNLTCLANPNWEFTTSQNLAIDIPLAMGTTLNFGLQPINDIYQGEVDITYAATRCGFTVPIWLNNKNTGTFTNNGMVSFELDDLVNFVDAIPSPDSIDGNTLFWFFEDLNPTYSELITIYLQMPGVDYIGDSIEFKSDILLTDSSGATVFLEEFSSQSQINCAYDPNDKMVYPDFPGDVNYTLFEETLEYTIRFQNTGTDTAFNIWIHDVLDDDLDWSTFEPIAASHFYSTSLDETGKIIFSFENILLPDSTTNEPLSHGFVKYRIQPNENLEENTVILNTASIFFDFNPAIVTNIVSNIMVSEYPKIVSVNEVSKDWLFNIYPNPSDGNINVDFDFSKNTDWELHIFDATGLGIRKIEAPKNGSEKESISINNLPPGVYFVTIQVENQILAKKIIVMKD